MYVTRNSKGLLLPWCHAHVKKAGERTNLCMKVLLLLWFNIDCYHKEVLISVILFCKCYVIIYFVVSLVVFFHLEINNFECCGVRC